MRSLRRKGGLTLVELLVVIVILLILTAVAIPVMAPNVEQKRIRESARMASTFLSGAKSKAVENDSQVGVLFERLASNPNASMVLTYLETPPPYAGDYLNSTVNINANGTINSFTQAETMWEGLIRQGDGVKLNYRGRTYQLFCGEPFIDLDRDGTKDSGEYVDLNVNGSWDNGAGSVDDDGFFKSPVPDPTTNPNVIWSLAIVENGRVFPVAFPSALSNVPFSIIRQPIKSAAAPLQLPDGAVIDLSVSGLGAAGLLTTTLPANPTDKTTIVAGNTDPIAIMFQPSGAYQLRVGSLQMSVTDTLHLMVGRSDGVNVAPIASEKPNLADLGNMWLSVSSQGTISTTENAKYLGANEPLQNARAIAATHQTVGGR